MEFEQHKKIKQLMMESSKINVVCQNLERWREQSLLLSHVFNYPCVCWSDLYKFIFQGTCGWRHLTRLDNVESIYNKLLNEFKIIMPEEGMIIELLERETQIVRVNLKVWKHYELPIELLWKKMLNVNVNPREGLKLFRKRWRELIYWFDKGILGTNSDENHTIIAKWLETINLQVMSIETSDELMLIHHSDLFRKTYKPSYRLAIKKDIEAILAKIKDF